jgi:predicted dehydrogenase
MSDPEIEELRDKVAFLKAGVHVICDKPLTASLAEGKKMKAAGRQVGPHLRAHPQLHRLSARAPHA